MAPQAVPFAKYSGCGNDFILVDNREGIWPLGTSPTNERQEISRLCHRRFGIGADGFIFLETASNNSYRMRIFNADGGETEMCGNGLRCMVGFMRDSGIVGDHFDIHTMHHHVRATLHTSHAENHSHLVEVHMPAPFDIAYFTKLTVDEHSLTTHYLNTGVPHVVIFVSDLESPEWMEIAPKIRFHPHFHPSGTNVNFVSLTNGNALFIRTYERGVEQETLACGTGAAAAALVATAIHGMQSPITVHTRSTEILHITVNDTANPPQLTMTGPATRIFQGHLQRK